MATCFPVAQGQVAGLQIVSLSLILGAALIKFGPWFKYLNSLTWLTAPCFIRSGWWRRASFVAPGGSPPDWSHTAFAQAQADLFAFLVLLGPLLYLLAPVLLAADRAPLAVYVGLSVQVGMHVYICVSGFGLHVDVNVWNLASGLYAVLLFGFVRTGFDWPGLRAMHPALLAYMLLWNSYVVFGFVCPDRGERRETQAPQDPLPWAGGPRGRLRGPLARLC